jgi:hypothetical protein
LPELVKLYRIITVYRRFQKNSSLVPILSQNNPTHNLSPFFFNIHFNIVLHVRPRLALIKLIFFYASGADITLSNPLLSVMSYAAASHRQNKAKCGRCRTQPIATRAAVVRAVFIVSSYSSFFLSFSFGNRRTTLSF